MINCRKSLIFRSLLKYPTRAKLKRNELNELFQSFLQKHPCRQIRTLAESNEQSQNSEWLDKEFHRKTRPNSLMSRTMYLVNVETASKISKHLTNKTSDRTPTIVETNPGPGMLTEFLVERGVTDLRLFEGREEFVAHLDDRYVKVHPDRVKLQHFDLANLQRLMHLDNSHKILSTLPTTEWQSDINFRLFVATGSMIFFRQLITSVVFKNGLLATGRFESYVAVPSIIYMVSRVHLLTDPFHIFSSVNYAVDADEFQFSWIQLLPCDFNFISTFLRISTVGQISQIRFRAVHHQRKTKMRKK